MSMFCTYFGCDVELTEERKIHIRTYHPDAYSYLERFPDVLLNTEVIHRDYQPNSFLFGKRYPDIFGGKYLVLVLIRDRERTWVITAYVARKITTGTEIWKLKNSL